MDPSQPSIDVDTDEVPTGYWDRLRARVATWPVMAEDDVPDFDGFASEALDED